MNFLSLPPKLLSSGLREQNASFITHSPHYYLCFKTLGGPAAPHHLPLTFFFTHLFQQASGLDAVFSDTAGSSSGSVRGEQVCRRVNI